MAYISAALRCPFPNAFAEPDSLSWSGEVVTLTDPDDRTLILMATPVFRMRFAEHWPMDVEEE